MAWQGKQLASLLNSLAALNAAGQGRRGNWNQEPRQAQEGLCRHRLELYSLRLLQLRLPEDLLSMQAGPWQCEAEQDRWTVFKANCTGYQLSPVNRLERQVYRL
eukprot:5522530-Amphidinium_carterae.1